MQIIAGAALAAIFASPLVTAAAIRGTATLNDAPSLVARQALCTATLTGVNSEGGGGPGQAPIDNNNFSLKVNGPGGSAFEDCSGTGSTAVDCSTVDKSQYGGSYDTTCSASWDYGGNAWYSCSCNQVGGAVQPQTIDSNIVSETTDTCIVVYDC